MEENMVTLGLYFEIMDSNMYGGKGTTGYANISVDLTIANLQKADVCKYAEEQIDAVASMCHVGVDKVRIISRVEYEENTDDE